MGRGASTRTRTPYCQRAWRGSVVGVRSTAVLLVNSLRIAEVALLIVRHARTSLLAPNTLGQRLILEVCALTASLVARAKTESWQRNLLGLEKTSVGSATTVHTW